MMPKTSTQRAADRKARLRAEGLKEVRNLWVPPEHEVAIRNYAAWLVKLKRPA